MGLIAAINWHELFVPSVPLFELFLRGSFMYALILFGMRIFRRGGGSLSTADLLVVVLIADAAQNAMASEYRSITEGAVLVATIFFWNYSLDWLCYRYPRVHRLLSPKPLLLIKNGRLHLRNLRSEMLTKADLAEQLREQGIEDFSQVKQCCLESDGHLSVIRFDPQANRDVHPRKREPNG